MELIQGKTPATMRGGKHFFQRYFFTDEYAKLMRCARCGLSISSVNSEQEAKVAIIDSGGNPNKCTKILVEW